MKDGEVQCQSDVYCVDVEMKCDVANFIIEALGWISSAAGLERVIRKGFLHAFSV
jgi:hypothetical protein